MSEREKDKLTRFKPELPDQAAARHTQEGGRGMITFPVNLKDVNEVIDFVNLANKIDCDVDLKYGSCIYDAKSVISAMLISAAHSIVMQVHADREEELKIKEKFEKYICA